MLSQDDKELDAHTALLIERLRNRKAENEGEHGNMLLMHTLEELVADLSEPPSNKVVLKIIRTATVKTLEETGRAAAAECLCLDAGALRDRDQYMGDLLVTVLARNFDLPPYRIMLARLFEIVWSMLEEAGKLKRRRRKPRR